MMKEIINNKIVDFYFMTGRQPYRLIINKNMDKFKNCKSILVERVNRFQMKEIYRVIKYDNELLLEYRKPIKHTCIHGLFDDFIKSYILLGNQLIEFKNPQILEED